MGTCEIIDTENLPERIKNYSTDLNADLLIKGEDSGFMSKVSLALNPPRPKQPRDSQKDTKNKKEEQ